MHMLRSQSRAIKSCDGQLESPVLYRSGGRTRTESQRTQHSSQKAAGVGELMEQRM